MTKSILLELKQTDFHEVRRQNTVRTVVSFSMIWNFIYNMFYVTVIDINVAGCYGVTAWLLWKLFSARYGG